MIGGYILLNGEILAQIQSDDFDNPTEISKADFEKVYNAVKAGKELRVELMDTVIPVIALKYDDTFCSLTFAYDNEGITLLTFVLEVTIDDTDPDNPVYTYSGVVQETEVGGGGGGLPDITVADYEKMLTVNAQGKLILKKIKYDIVLTSADGVTWDTDTSFSTLQDIIGTAPRLPLRFDIELKVGDPGSEIPIGGASNVAGVLVSTTGDSFVQFTVDATKYITIGTSGVTVYFE